MVKFPVKMRKLRYAKNIKIEQSILLRTSPSLVGLLAGLFRSLQLDKDVPLASN